MVQSHFDFFAYERNSMAHLTSRNMPVHAEADHQVRITDIGQGAKLIIWPTSETFASEKGTNIEEYLLDNTSSNKPRILKFKLQLSNVGSNRCCPGLK